MSAPFGTGQELTADDLNAAVRVGGTIGGLVRTGSVTNASTSETLIDFRTFDAVTGRRYIPKLSSNLLISGGSSPAAFTIRFRWAAGSSVSAAGNLIDQINDFVSTGSFQHYRFYEAALDYGGSNQQISVGVFALAIAPMTQLRFPAASATDKRHFRVVDDGPY